MSSTSQLSDEGRETERAGEKSGRDHQPAHPAPVALVFAVAQRRETVTSHNEASAETALDLGNEPLALLGLHFGEVVDVQLATVAVTDPVVPSEVLPPHGASGSDPEFHTPMDAEHCEEFEKIRRRAPGIRLLDDGFAGYPPRMSRKAVLEVLSKARRGIARHWLSCIEAGLGGHSPLLIGRVDAALKRYVETLGRMQHPASKARIMAAMKTLFRRLDTINAEADGGLLETDERELLVPVIVDAAVAAGLDLSAFDDRDPTFALRNF
jgi:hypothetical protein